LSAGTFYEVAKEAISGNLAKVITLGDRPYTILDFRFWILKVLTLSGFTISNVGTINQNGITESPGFQRTPAHNYLGRKTQT